MLSKSKRLSTEEFQSIIDKGQAFHSPFILIRLISGPKSSKFAVSVPKKVAKTAVLKNKIRRQVYSAIKEFGNITLHGLHVVIIMKVGSEKLSFTELSDEIKKIFVKSRILK